MLFLHQLIKKSAIESAAMQVARMNVRGVSKAATK